MWTPYTILIFEIIAAITGTIYLYKTPVQKTTRYLVYFLWLTVIIECFFATVKWCIFHFESLYHLKNSLLIQNYWAYNIYMIISGLFYIYYFEQSIISPKIKTVLKIMMIIFFCSYCTSLVVTGTYFNSIQLYPEILVSLFILIAVFLYLYDMIQDDVISSPLNLHLFIGFGIIVFHLLFVLLLLYGNMGASSYNTTSFFKIFLTIACVLLYGFYTAGFIICLRGKTNSF